MLKFFNDFRLLFYFIVFFHWNRILPRILRSIGPLFFFLLVLQTINRVSIHKEILKRSLLGRNLSRHLEQFLHLMV